MKRVKIINGLYGYKPQGCKFVDPVHAGSLCMVSNEEAERLVKLGIGICVGDANENLTTPLVARLASDKVDNDEGDNPLKSGGSSEGKENDSETPDIVDSYFTAESLMLMSKANLNKLAEDLGADVSKCKNKSEMVDILTSIEVNSSEAPPLTGAENPVL